MQLPNQSNARVAIYGSSGSGKSSLAAKLSTLLDCPVIHIDDLFWLPNWMEPDYEHFRKQVLEAITAETWVIDGNYSKLRKEILPFVRFIIILKFPLMTVLWRIFLRQLVRRFRLPFSNITPSPKRILESQTKERFLEATFVLWKQAIKFKVKSYPEILKDVRKLPDYHCIILRNQKQVDLFIGYLKTYLENK